MTTPYYEADGIQLYHGDCREIDAWESAAFLLTDPPFGISWQSGEWRGKKGITGRKHEGIANDSDTAARDYVLGRWGRVRPAAVFGSPLLAPPQGTKQSLVWRKAPDSGFMGSVGGWRRDWEVIYLLGNWPGGPVVRSGVITTNVGLATYRTGHPHAKPVALMEAILATDPGGCVADPFTGSGSVLIAARNLGRRAIGVEIDERYCELTAKRLDQGCLDFGEGA